MSDNKQLKEDLLFIQKGLFKMGRNRVAALSAHKTWELTDELEKRIARAIAAIETEEA